MKRTKENWLFGHPEDRTDLSGLRIFDGEDLHYQERKRAQQETQRKWLDQQRMENEMKHQADRDEERAYAMQTQQITRMRALNEEELARKQRTMAVSTKQANVNLKQEFKDKNRMVRDTVVHEENHDYAHQTRIRVVDPYQNPLN